jgi:hypothetical protein
MKKSTKSGITFALMPIKNRLEVAHALAKIRIRPHLVVDEAAGLPRSRLVVVAVALEANIKSLDGGYVALRRNIHFLVQSLSSRAPSSSIDRGLLAPLFLNK